MTPPRLIFLKQLVPVQMIKRLLSDRISLSSAEVRAEGIKGGSVGVGEGIPIGVHAH